MRAEKAIFTRLIRRGTPDRIAWVLLQWWEDPEGSEEDPIRDPAHRANLRAATDHIGARLAELGPRRRAEVAAAMRRAGNSQPSQGGIFVEEMPAAEKEQRTDRLMALFGLIEPARGADSDGLAAAPASGPGGG